jgi:hypothetical protein
MAFRLKGPHYRKLIFYWTSYSDSVTFGRYGKEEPDEGQRDARQAALREDRLGDDASAVANAVANETRVGEEKREIGAIGSAQSPELHPSGVTQRDAFSVRPAPRFCETNPNCMIYQTGFNHLDGKCLELETWEGVFGFVLPEVWFWSKWRKDGNRVGCPAIRSDQRRYVDREPDKMGCGSFD